MSDSPPARGARVELAPPGPEPSGLGRFGEFGGRFVPETLVPALIELERDFRAAWHDDAFRADLTELLTSRRPAGGRHAPARRHPSLTLPG